MGLGLAHPNLNPYPYPSPHRRRQGLANPNPHTLTPTPITPAQIGDAKAVTLTSAAGTPLAILRAPETYEYRAREVIYRTRAITLTSLKGGLGPLTPTLSPTLSLTLTLTL